MQLPLALASLFTLVWPLSDMAVVGGEGGKSCLSELSYRGP